MERRFRITVDGHPYNVTVEDLDDPGAMPSALPSSLPPVPWQAAAPTAPLVAAAVTAPAAAGKAPGDSAPGDVLATLGGVVESVVVSVGQAVQKGDTLVVIEAMKMNSPMVAPRSGSVTRLCVKPGEPVEAGHVLATVA